MASTSASPGACYEDQLEAVVVAAVPPTGKELRAATQELAALAVEHCLRGGLTRGSHTFVFSIAGGGPDHSVTIDSVPSDGPPFVATPHAQADAVLIEGANDTERLASLAALDDPKPVKRGRKVPFYRSSSRLAAAVAKAATLERPNFKICSYQLAKSFAFGGGPPPSDRPLGALVLGASDNAARVVRDPGYKSAMEEAASLADYTTHDPDTLHPRFLEYVRERVTSVDDRTSAALSAARAAQAQLWADSGVHAPARDLSDAAPEPLAGIINHGSTGEYRALGVSDRKDPRLISLMSQSLLRYGAVGKLAVAGKRPPRWVASTLQPTLSFGKEEPKPAKRDPDGRKVPPIPRFIFNLSPVNYALAAFLHSDLSHQLQERDPTHGPGFGPGRGRSGKFLAVVQRAFGTSCLLPEGEEMVMSDIQKWDASIVEALTEPTFDNLEAAVDTTHLGPAARATRSAMVGVARRQLNEKLLEHPSGYLLMLYGTMPSGSYYTSLINTNANNLLLLSHIIDRAVSEGTYTPAGAAEDLRHHIRDRLLSYGDNQLFSSALFKVVGLRYDPQKHAEFLSRFGMKLKIDETEVTRHIGRVRFCSRAVVMTPHGPIITRTHTSLVSKLAARPEHDPVVDKLYVRAIMADHMGTDPVAYEMLATVDRQIDVPVDLSVVTPRVKGVLSAASRSLYGTDADEVMLIVLKGLSQSVVDRRALLSLHTPRDGVARADIRLGMSVSMGDALFGGPLTDAARFCLSHTPATWVEFLRETGQEGAMID
uniref:RNA-dependent RNA polymerase n=2 Tax=Beauveria bassiana polymycovirus 3 TaxID=1740648 RepID=A0A7R9RDP6_9VIRU|nr:RNA-dependent RNA polymerase [Beauveria bassiana polymycovirus 3]